MTKFMEEIPPASAPHRIQVFGDGKGRAVHLGERDCSLSAATRRCSRRPPAPASAKRERDRIGKVCADAVAAINIARGTIEFLYEDGEFFFIEMNTRLQVEHPVTGDLRRGSGARANPRGRRRRMEFRQEDLKINGALSKCGSMLKTAELLALPRQDHAISCAWRSRRAHG